jgi:predicted secreted protein
MKLSKIILENNKIIERAELTVSDKDIDNLSEAIAVKLQDYLDIEKPDVLLKIVKEAVSELVK